MQLIHICPTYKPAYQYGGPTISISKLCELLQTSRTKPIVLTTSGNGKTELAVKRNSLCYVEGVSVWYFNRLTKDHSHFSPALCFHLYRHIRIQKMSGNDNLIIHIHSWWNLVSILSCVIARICNIKTIISPRGMLTSFSFVHTNRLIKGWIHYLIGNWLLNGCHLHATTEKEKQDILTYIKPKSITVLPNIVNVPLVNPITTECDPGQPLKLLFFSRIDEKKGIELLLNAVAKLNVKYCLTIAGTGTSTYILELQFLATTLGIDKNIKWLGNVCHSAKYDELGKHDLLILPSYNENFANVVLESLSVGTAVLLSDQVGLSDYIQETNLGWVSRLSATEFAAHIEGISNSREDLAAIRITAPQRIAEDFNAQILLKQYLHFYNGLVATA